MQFHRFRMLIRSRVFSHGLFRNKSNVSSPSPCTTVENAKVVLSRRMCPCDLLADAVQVDLRLTVTPIFVSISGYRCQNTQASPYSKVVYAPQDDRALTTEAKDNRPSSYELYVSLLHLQSQTSQPLT